MLCILQYSQQSQLFPFVSQGMGMQRAKRLETESYSNQMLRTVCLE